ncbi:phosphatidate cytidylyltransferase [Peribacillus kribbensis]|uniref:phosphatidate cytidylyltransferase n=1 Tax=Peribacillus kribbensis TaxID=356658 RepID=UPI0004224E0E|nr:phosphatidate cytidylyltransferase [Peribacillus kribbensis]
MRQRIITGVVAAAIFLPIVIWGGWPLLLITYLLGTIGLYELLKMRKLSVVSIPALLSFAGLWVVLLPPSAYDTLKDINYSKFEIILLLVLLLLTFTVITKNKYTFDDAGFMMLAVLYVGMGFFYFYQTREMGLVYIFFALFVIWATDSGAYFVGRALGRRKLWPEISPNKTIEGAVGGIICGILVAVIFYFAADMQETIGKLAAIAIFISVFGQIGDLVQSAYKRRYGVKDSGNILPGHGGILDRLDSLIFVLPILHLLHLI